MTELEKELGLALEEQQVESLSASAPTSLSPCSVEAPQNESQSRERSHTTGSRPEEPPRRAARYSSTWYPKCGQRETQVVVEGGAIAIQQQEELAVQKEELGQPVMDNQQDLIDVDVVEDPEDKEATDALPAA